VAAADVRDRCAPFELFLDAVERGDPTADEVLAVARSEEPLGPAEEAVVVLMPADSASGAKRVEEALLVGEQRHDHLVHARR
jgi:hypothetical protein